MRQITNRVSLPQTFDPGKFWSKAETQHVLFVSVNGQIKVRWPNWSSDAGGETAPGAAATGTAQITYTDRTTGLPVVVNMLDETGGTTALTAPDGDYFKAVATIDALAGTRIFPRIRANFPNGIFYSQFKSDLVNGDRYEFGTSAPSALATAPTQTFADTWYGPCAILGMSNTPVAGIVGDSREDGLYDVPNTSRGDGGTYSRLFGEAGVPYVNVGSRGDKAQLWAPNTSNARRRALLTSGGVTFIALGNGTNDLIAGRTTAQVDTDNTTTVANLGLPAIWKTLDPFTGADYTTPSGSGNANRIAYNTLVRARPVYFDPAGVLESVPSPGGWGNPYAPAAAVGDAPNLLHEANAGNAYAAANAAVVGTTVAQYGIAARAAGTPFVMASSFDPTNKDAAVTLSELNRRMTSAGVNKGVKGTSSRSVGLLYFEVKQVAATAGTPGLGNAAGNVGSWVGSDGNSRGFDGSSGLSYTSGTSSGSAGVGSIASGDVLGVAVNFTSGKCWFSKNGAFGSGQNPVTQSGGFSLPSGALFIMVAGGSGASFQIATETYALSYAPPAGFSPWA